MTLYIFIVIIIVEVCHFGNIAQEVIMPQVVFMFTEEVGNSMPRGQEELSCTLALQYRLAEMLDSIKPEIVKTFEVPKGDIASSAINLPWTFNEADLQIEIRYTVGINTYKEGLDFEPSLAIQEQLKAAVITAVRRWLKLPGNNFQISISIQTVPTRGTYSFYSAEKPS